MSSHAIKITDLPEILPKDSLVCPAVDPSLTGESATGKWTFEQLKIFLEVFRPVSVLPTTNIDTSVKGWFLYQQDGTNKPSIYILENNVFVDILRETLTGAEIVALIDTNIGNSNWKAKLTGAQIVALINTAIGDVDWQERGSHYNVPYDGDMNELVVHGYYSGLIYDRSGGSEDGLLNVPTDPVTGNKLTGKFSLMVVVHDNEGSSTLTSIIYQEIRYVEKGTYRYLRLLETNVGEALPTTITSNWGEYKNEQPNDLRDVLDQAANCNIFNNAEKTKLTGIDTGASKDSWVDYTIGGLTTQEEIINGNTVITLSYKGTSFYRQIIDSPYSDKIYSTKNDNVLSGLVAERGE